MSRIDYARRDLLVIGVDGSIPPEIAAAIAAGKIDAVALAKLAQAAGAQARPPRPVVSKNRK